MALVLFISPHPDDECLSMGMGIANHIWNGHDVYLALLSHGEGSGAIDNINGGEFCGWHDRYHDTVEEGYKPISIHEFGDARVNEFKYSAYCLGVRPENISIYDYYDGSITKEDVKSVIRDFLKLHKGAYIKTTSYLDIHEDHRASGDALLELYNNKEVDDARFYLSPQLWNPDFGDDERNPECTAFHGASIAVYKRWNPMAGIYGIGYHSVSELFDIVSRDLKSVYHMP